ncbi:MAG: hypothetical protein FWH18_01945 [Marinilabiliaceae bacterium]|nr:hypothetical protein [Marinilabiliaceae bacterium]
MKIFNFFKAKHAVVTEIDNNNDPFIDELFLKIFPNGDTDLIELTNNLLIIINNAISKEEAKHLSCAAAITAYSDGGFSSRFCLERLQQHLAGKGCLKYFNKQKLQEFYALLRKYHKPKDIDLKSVLPKDYLAWFLDIVKSNPQATNEDEISDTSGEFGLEPTNPVPVFGVPNNDVYLGRLRTLNGMPIYWDRVGCIELETIFQPVDNYDIYDAKKNKIANIYISSYHLSISKKAPKGFILIK